VVPNNYLTDKGGKKYRNGMNGQTVLDYDAPYVFSCEGKLDPKKLKSVMFATASRGSAGDSPSIQLDSEVGTLISADSAFKMYIMFKPYGPNASWVPLKYEAWSWKGTATFQEKQWILSNPGKSLDPPQATSDHPTWTQRVQDSEMVLDK